MSDEPAGQSSTGPKRPSSQAPIVQSVARMDAAPPITPDTTLVVSEVKFSDSSGRAVVSGEPRTSSE